MEGSGTDPAISSEMLSSLLDGGGDKGGEVIWLIFD
jgi:hypothetical protein